MGMALRYRLQRVQPRCASYDQETRWGVGRKAQTS